MNRFLRQYYYITFYGIDKLILSSGVVFMLFNINSLYPNHSTRVTSVLGINYAGRFFSKLAYYTI